MTPGWPVVLESEGVRLRPLAVSDRKAWRDVRRDNAAWLRRWEATSPPGGDPRPHSFGSMVRGMRRAARQGRMLPFAVEYDDRFVGQLTVNNIVRGSAQFASMGYWIDSRVAGRGIMTRAVAMTIDHCLGPVGLHRIEISIRPENTASLRIVEKLGITEIGLAPRYLHIDGGWRDHRVFGITREEVPAGVLARLRSQQSQE